VTSTFISSRAVPCRPLTHGISCRRLLFVIGVLAQIVATYAARRLPASGFGSRRHLPAWRCFLPLGKIRQHKRLSVAISGPPHTIFRSIWNPILPNQHLTRLMIPTLCACTAELNFSETFNVLSSAFGFLMRKKAAETEASLTRAPYAGRINAKIEFPSVDPSLTKMRKAFYLEKITDNWALDIALLVKRNFTK